MDYDSKNAKNPPYNLFTIRVSMAGMKIYANFERFLATENDMLALAADFARLIKPGTVIFLMGSLGAGKTTFTRGLLRGLGYQAKVKSPTYTLIEPYTFDGKTLYHFDLYRVKDARELEYIGLNEYFTPDSICIIEWPEKGFPYLPTADFICYFTIKNEGREIKIVSQSAKEK